MEQTPNSNIDSMIAKVFKFNREVLGIEPRSLQTVHGTEWDHLLHCLQEEVDEFEDAGGNIDQIDALCDLIYFAIGGFVKMGLTEEEVQQAFAFVHEANMTKAAGKKAGREYDGAKDAVKPVNFVPPETKIMNMLLSRRDV